MNTWKRWFMVGMAFLIVFLVACAPAAAPMGDEPVYQTAEPTSVSAIEATADEASAAEASAAEVAADESAAASKTETITDGAVMVYTRSGGLKSFRPTEATFTFYADGRIVSSDGREWQVAPEEIEKLVNDVMALGFAEFEASYIPEDTCCDRVTHTLTVRQGDQVYTVTVLDEADAPPELFQAAEMVNNYLIALPTG